MKMQGLEGMLEFLEFLRKKRIMFKIEQQVHDGLEVSFALVGYRFEVTFFTDHMEFSYFTGHEDVETDEALLFELINQNSD
jgi:hypothetical protein